MVNLSSLPGTIIDKDSPQYTMKSFVDINLDDFVILRTILQIRSIQVNKRQETITSSVSSLSLLLHGSPVTNVQRFSKCNTTSHQSQYSGKYSCKARNYLGGNMLNIRLTVFQIPVLPLLQTGTSLPNVCQINILTKSNIILAHTKTLC